MLRSRFFEEGVEDAASRSLIWGTYHLSIGQEASHVGVSLALKEGDILVPTHRCHGYNVAGGSSLYAMYSELLGSRHGLCKGLGGSMHMTDILHGNFGSSAVVGSGISIAGGVALSMKRKGQGNITVSVFGDGASSRGTLHEMMNIASIWNLPILFLLENNRYGMSALASRMISTDKIYKRADGYGIENACIDGNDVVSVLKATEKAREYIVREGRPYFLELETYRMCGHSRSDKNIYRSAEEEDEWRVKDPILRYKAFLLSNGILKEEEIEDIENGERVLVKDALERAIDDKDDVLSVSELESLAEPRFSSMPISFKPTHKASVREAIREALDEILSENPSAFLMGEDIGRYGGCFGVTGDLYEKHPEQVLETPVSEETFTGMAVGSGAMGSPCIVELMYGDFSTLSSDAMVNHAAKLHFMSAGQLNSPMILRLPMGGGTGHGAQHTQSLENLFRIPGLTVVAPSDAYSAKALLKSAAIHKTPVVFVEHKLLYGEIGDVGGSDSYLPLGKAIVKGRGSDLLVIGYSHAFSLAMKALSEVRERITFIDLATIYPLDEETIKAESERIGKVLIVEDTPLEGSVGESVYRIIGGGRVEFAASRSMPTPFSRSLEAYSLITEEHIREKAKLLLSD